MGFLNSGDMQEEIGFEDVQVNMMKYGADGPLIKSSSHKHD